MEVQPNLFSSDLELEFFDVVNTAQKHKVTVATKEGVKLIVLSTQISSIKSYLNGLYESRKQAYTDPTILTLSYFEATETILKEMLTSFDVSRVINLIDILKKIVKAETSLKKLDNIEKFLKTLNS